MWDHVLHDIEGNDSGVTDIYITHVQSGKKTRVPLDGVFIAIGHTPNTTIFNNQLVMDENGYIQLSPGTTATTEPGVFAAGDVADPIYRQAVTSAGFGCMAALDAERYLNQSST